MWQRGSGRRLKTEFKLNGFFHWRQRPPFNGNENTFSRDAWVGLSVISIACMWVAIWPRASGLNDGHLQRVWRFLCVLADRSAPTCRCSMAPTGRRSMPAIPAGAIRFATTPNFGGFSANLHYQFGEVAGASSNRKRRRQLPLSTVPSALGGFVHNVRTNNPNAGTVGSVNVGFSQQKAWMLSGKAAVGPVNLYANYEKAKNDNYAGAAGNAESKTWSLSADMAVGPGKVLAGYADTKWTTTPTSARNGSKRDTFSLGYDYNFSKRTDGYVVFMNDKITNYDRGNSFAVGIRHRF